MLRSQLPWGPLGPPLCAPSAAESPPPVAVSQNQLSSELARPVESSVSSAASEPLLRIAEALTVLQSSLEDISTRLDAAAGFQAGARRDPHPPAIPGGASAGDPHGAAPGGTDGRAY
ncbi:hypothetical protein FJT64_009324 [Amphibalanus amphitrite]|uniref:Uncharacterized protein n=1 Tax=Amphibalanus amphitrite TaxID=1232801 RepID=A0A6A4VPU5_AMPAM|nr:hypothetical protein FJT64_009321 [Amphibalanus amphitrite]KAF0292705.1 hypothetical protein FJT64_009324 [Amphibalanus amphitrite]